MTAQKYCSIVLIGCAALLCTLSVVSTQQLCRTPLGASGACVPYDQCTFVVESLRRYGANVPTVLRDFLIRSQCQGPDQGRTHICCDVTDITTTRSPTTTTTFATPTVPATTQVNSAVDYISSLSPRGLSILSSIKCGDSSTVRVAFGNKTKLFEYPWMALLRYQTSFHPFKCGASLITNQYVLTAAHCITAAKVPIIEVRLGEHYIDTDRDCQQWGPTEVCAPPVVDIGVDKIILHPGYNQRTMINDIALIKLDRPVQFQRHIKPICLPITEPSLNVNSIEEYFIAGWGTTENGTTSNELIQALIPAQPLQVCQNIFRRSSITTNHLCVGGGHRSDSCKGDSGGPLFQTAPYQNGLNRYVQYGIVSFGTRHCGSEEAYPGIYSNIIDLMPWITSNIE